MNLKTYLRNIGHNYLLLLLTFRYRFPHYFFLFRPNGIFIAQYLQHLFVTGFVKNTVTTVFNISSIPLTVITFRLIVKGFLLKVLPQIQRMTVMEFIHLLRKELSTPFCFLNLFSAPSQKMRACHTRWHFFFPKNSIFGHFDETNPITGKDTQLRSPIPIMAPGYS